jgi:hypothetical protein
MMANFKNLEPRLRFVKVSYEVIIYSGSGLFLNSDAGTDVINLKKFRQYFGENIVKDHISRIIHV